MRRVAITALAALLPVQGCVTLSREAAMGDIERLAAERTGKRVHWNRGTAEDEAAQKVVRELLSGELTAGGAVQVALLNNRNLQATYEGLGIAQADLVQAGLLRNPVFDGEFRFFRPGTSAELSVVQDFISVFQLPLRKRVAGAAFEAAKLGVAQAVLDLGYDTAKAFYAVQAAEQVLEMRRTVLEATEASAEAARRLHEAGNITDLDLANDVVLHEQSKLDLLSAEAEALEAREKLNALMGAWGEGTNWRVSSRLPEPPEQELKSEGLESLAVSQRLDLAAARQEAVALGEALGLARIYRLFPELGLGVSVEREAEGGGGPGPALSVPIPLFDRGQASVFRADAELKRSLERYWALAVEIRSEVRAAFTRVLAARARYLRYQMVVLPLRHRIVEETQRQYNAMLVGVFQLLQAKRDEIEAGGEAIEALKEFWAARSDLDRAVGGRLDAGAKAREVNATHEESAEGPAQGQEHHHGG